MSEAAVSHYLAEYQRCREALAPACPAPRRTQALAYLETHGFPTPRVEQWKYTDVSPITRRQFTLAPAPADVDEALVAGLRFSGLECHELVFINGHFCERLSHRLPLPDGVSVGALQSDPAGNASLLERYFGDEEIGHAFTALNTAFLNDGALVQVPDGMELSTPVHIIYLGGRAGDEDGDAESGSQSGSRAAPMSHPRTLVALGRQAGASIIETYAGASDSEYFTNSHTSILAQAGARLDYYKIQREGGRAYHVGSTRVRQQADSRVDCHALSLGGKLARWELDVALDEPGAAVNLNGLYLTDHRQHVDNHTLVEHKSPHTSSNEQYRGVMNGRSRAVFNGKVIVHEQAQKTEAHQSNANLLLSPHAEVDTKPELEIYADDVKCSHGATVGRLDEDMLFYLRSRAVAEDTARSLLTYAFADEIIRDIKLPGIREQLNHNIAGELPDTRLLEEFMV